jgi:hypothetical protein
MWVWIPEDLGLFRQSARKPDPPTTSQPSLLEEEPGAKVVPAVNRPDRAHKTGAHCEDPNHLA